MTTETKYKSTQNIQLPSLEGRAAETTDSAAYFLQKANYVRATLHHINGMTSHVLMIVPEYSEWGEMLEDGQIAMREYIHQLTRRWIKISHFYTEFGNLESDGSFSPLCGGILHDIPLNKVYKSGSRGEWVAPDQHPSHHMYNQRGSSMELDELTRVVSKRNEAVFKKVDSNKTQCGVPISSMQYYFIEGDVPEGTFEHAGETYAVVYSFIKSDLKGGASC